MAVGWLGLLAILLIGLTAISFGSILAKLAQEAPPLTVAFFRMLWASLILLPFFLARNPSSSTETSRGNPAGTHAVWWLIAGLMLALHFAFWIASLYYSSVAVSVLLVSTSPVAAAILSRVFLGERISRAGIAGIVVAFGGSMVLFWEDLANPESWKGPLLALSGAAAFGLYLVAGKKIRRTASLIEYVYPTYVLAAILLGAAAFLSGSPFRGFAVRTWAFLFLLGLVPQSIGHTSYNWALRFLPATVVSTLVLAEPITASLLAYWLLGETVGPLVFLGGALVACGILLVTLRGVVESPR